MNNTSTRAYRNVHETSESVRCSVAEALAEMSESTEEKAEGAHVTLPACVKAQFEQIIMPFYVEQP
jgi:hypothetical protein